jgi:prepilin-type processing-associated H-X9-DG protein
LRAAGDTLLVAADGSGVIADLGGNATDSLLTPAERHHTAVASEAIREAVFQYAVGNVRYFEGHTADAKAAFLAAAEIFSGLMWRCPQAGLSANEVLLYADQAAAMALGRLKPDDQTRWEIMDDPASRCMRNLHQLVYGLLLCSEDFHGVLFPPQLGNPAAFQETLQPWVGPASVFINPITNRPYRANVALSGKALAGFPDRSAVVAFYEDSPGLDGTRGVAFLDGHVERVSESQWEALTKSSNLP